MNHQKFDRLPVDYHTTPTLADLDKVEREHGLIYYDGFLLSVRFYKDGRCELVSWVDTEMYEGCGPVITTDLFLTCDLTPQLALEIAEGKSDICFGDVYLQPGAKFHLEAYARIDCSTGYEHLPVTRQYLGSFLNVHTDYLPTSLAVSLKIN